MKIIVIDGIIGSGKTTLIKKLKETYKDEMYIGLEPVDQWISCGILQRFYQNRKRWAYHFQTKVFHDRIISYKKSIDEASKLGVKYLVLERSILTDNIFTKMLYDNGDIDDMEWTHYLEWCGLWKELLDNIPDLFIYLRPTLDVSMKRLKERNRKGEEDITIEYQNKLLEEHDNFFLKTNICISNNDYRPVLLIDKNFEITNDDDVYEILNLINTKITNL